MGTSALEGMNTTAPSWITKVMWPNLTLQILEDLPIRCETRSWGFSHFNPAICNPVVTGTHLTYNYTLYITVVKWTIWNICNIQKTIYSVCVCRLCMLSQTCFQEAIRYLNSTLNCIKISNILQTSDTTHPCNFIIQWNMCNNEMLWNTTCNAFASGFWHLHYIWMLQRGFTVLYVVSGYMEVHMGLKSTWWTVELILFATWYTVLCNRASCRCSNSCKVLKKFETHVTPSRRQETFRTGSIVSQ